MNDEIDGNGICSSVDTLAPWEADANLTFVTHQPTEMAAGLYTYIPLTSTVDHIIVSTDILTRLLFVDGSSHRAAVVMHDDLTVSDHQPAFVWMQTQ